MCHIGDSLSYLPYSLDCQLHNGCMFMEDVGRGSGEQSELVNAQLKPLGSNTQYMHPARRMQLIEDFFLWQR